MASEIVSAQLRRFREASADYRYEADLGEITRQKTLPYKARLLDIVMSDEATVERAEKFVATHAETLKGRIVRLQLRVLSETSGRAAAWLSTELRGLGIECSLGLCLDQFVEALISPEVTGALDSAVDTLREVGVNFYGIFQVDEHNSYAADDARRWAENQDIDLNFHAVPNLLERSITPGLLDEDEAGSQFHASMFFDALPRYSRTTLAQRLYYRRLGDRLEFGSGGPDIDGSVSADGTALLRAEDVTRIAGRVLKAKLGIGVSGSSRLGRAGYDVPVRAVTAPEPWRWKHVIITGWYGTETHGDKAILGEVIHYIRSQSPACRITVSTISTKISSQSLVEMPELRGVDMVDIAQCADPALVETADAVIFGGGPIMESASMYDVWKIFAEANRQEKARVIFGSGVGPIHTDAVRDQVTSIIAMTTAGFTRDQESQAYATELCPGHVLRYACDPAVGYVHRWRATYGTQSPDDHSKIIALLRANTSEFKADADLGAINAANRVAAARIAALIEQACTSRKTTTDLLHMNAHWVGGDDRLFNRDVASAFEDPSRARVVRRYLSLERHLQYHASGGVALAMRYHGHVFSMALGIPFVSIDYTGRRGKVSSLVERIGYGEWSTTWDEVCVGGAAAGQLERLIDEREYWSAYLLERTSEFVELLERTYGEVFGMRSAT